MKLWSKIFACICAVAAASVLSFGLKYKHLKTGVVSAGTTEVLLNVTVRGSGGVAVKNANISVYNPHQIVLGKTNERGILSVTTELTSGRSLVLQADGSAFRMQRSLLIPRSQTYSATVFFDLAEVYQGNVTLLSTANSETTALTKIPTPVPSNMSIILEGIKIDENSKSKIINVLQAAARSLIDKRSYELKCHALSAQNVIFECIVSSHGREVSSSLVESLPQSVAEAEKMLSSLVSPPKKISREKKSSNEVYFHVRHQGQTFRAYFGEKRLYTWKENLGETIFSQDTSEFKSKTSPSMTGTLTLITENNEIFQKTFTLPPLRKKMIVRLPRLHQMNLSKRQSKR
jgi:hypothetical protein